MQRHRQGEALRTNRLLVFRTIQKGEGKLDIALAIFPVALFSKSHRRGGGVCTYLYCCSCGVSGPLGEGNDVGFAGGCHQLSYVNGATVHRCLLNHCVEVSSALEASAVCSPTTPAWSDGGTSTGSHALVVMVGPVHTDSTQAKDHSIHCGDGLLSGGVVAKRQKAVAKRVVAGHVQHELGIGR